MDGEGAQPTYMLEGRDALTPVFADLNRYDTTTHFNGQSTVTIDGDRATGESYTIAHHRLLRRDLDNAGRIPNKAQPLPKRGRPRAM
jgi:hypothetical protein